MTICRHEDFLEEVQQRHAIKIGVWKDTSAENVDSLITNTEVAKPDSVTRSVERYLILALFEDHVCAQQTSVDANVRRKVTLFGAISTVRELPEIVCPIN